MFTYDKFSPRARSITIPTSWIIEFNADIQWRPEGSFLNGFSARLRYSRMKQYTAPEDKQNDIRFIINYDFHFHCGDCAVPDHGKSGKHNRAEIQQSSCQDLWREKMQKQVQPQPEMGEGAIQALRNDPRCARPSSTE